MCIRDQLHPSSKSTKAFARRETRQGEDPSRASAVSALRSFSLRNPDCIMPATESVRSKNARNFYRLFNESGYSYFRPGPVGRCVSAPTAPVSRTIPAQSVRARPRFRHHQPDHGEARCGNARKPHECDAASETISGVAGQHGAEGSADPGRGADNTLCKIEVTASERDVGDNQRNHHAEDGRGDAIEHLRRNQQIWIADGCEQ